MNKARQDIIITGIPRSGTSYLCNLLNRYNNCVIINEPREAWKVTSGWWPGIRLRKLYKNIREKIVRGLPIENKIAGGEIIADTRLKDERYFYNPETSDQNFVLGIKNTLGFLLCLGDICKAMPTVTIVVNVRHPYDTIGSWLNSFAHLKTADVPRLSNKKIVKRLSKNQQAIINQIQQAGEVALRRALLWQLLSDIIIDNRQNIHLVNYNTLVANPQPLLNSFIGAMNIGKLAQPIEASQARRRDNRLTEQQKKYIDEQCKENAEKLGVWQIETTV